MDEHLDRILLEKFGEYKEPPEVTELKKKYVEKVEEANQIRKIRNERRAYCYQLERDLYSAGNKHKPLARRILKDALKENDKMNKVYEQCLKEISKMQDQLTKQYHTPPRKFNELKEGVTPKSPQYVSPPPPSYVTVSGKKVRKSQSNLSMPKWTDVKFKSRPLSQNQTPKLPTIQEKDENLAVKSFRKSLKTPLNDHSSIKMNSKKIDIPGDFTMPSWFNSPSHARKIPFKSPSFSFKRKKHIGNFFWFDSGELMGKLPLVPKNSEILPKRLMGNLPLQPIEHPKARSNIFSSKVHKDETPQQKSRAKLAKLLKEEAQNQFIQFSSNRNQQKSPSYQHKTPKLGHEGKSVNQIMKDARERGRSLQRKLKAKQERSLSRSEAPIGFNSTLKDDSKYHFSLLFGNDSKNQNKSRRPWTAPDIKTTDATQINAPIELLRKFLDGKLNEINRDHEQSMQKKVYDTLKRRENFVNSKEFKSKLNQVHEKMMKLKNFYTKTVRENFEIYQELESHFRKLQGNSVAMISKIQKGSAFPELYVHLKQLKEMNNFIHKLNLMKEARFFEGVPITESKAKEGVNFLMKSRKNLSSYIKNNTSKTDKKLDELEKNQKLYSVEKLEFLLHEVRLEEKVLRETIKTLKRCKNCTISFVQTLLQENYDAAFKNFLKDFFKKPTSFRRYSLPARNFSRNKIVNAKNLSLQ